MLATMDKGGRDDIDYPVLTLISGDGGELIHSDAERRQFDDDLMLAPKSLGNLALAHTDSLPFTGERLRNTIPLRRAGLVLMNFSAN